MDCIKYRKLISAYIDGETSNLETDAMLKHIAECDECGLILKNNTLLSEYITDSYMSSAPDKIDFSSQIMSRLDDSFNTNTLKQSKKRKFILLKGAAVAATITLLVGGYYFSKNNTNVVVKQQQDKITEQLVMEHIDKSNTSESHERQLPKTTFVNFRR